MYKVSLAIPIYNVSLFVERALLSVLNQTYDNIEYLIVVFRSVEQPKTIRNIQA